jgi:hypothetical protein
MALIRAMQDHCSEWKFLGTPECFASRLSNMHPDAALGDGTPFISGGAYMKNPWIKKNPFLSMWLSGANAVLGTARVRATAEGRRQATNMMNQAAKNMTQMWTAPHKTKRKKR